MDEMVWNWPQLVWLGLSVYALGVTITKHGEPGRPYSAGTQLLATGLSGVLLYFGGFWAGAAP